MRQVNNRVYPIRMSKKQWDIPIVNENGEKILINIFNFGKENYKHDDW